MKNRSTTILAPFQVGARLVSLAALTLGSSAFANLADYQSAVTNTANIISYYTFDQQDASDTFGLHNGTPVNPAYAAGVGGDGQGFLCNGSAQVNFGQVSDFEFGSGTGTIEGWVRADWSGIFTAYSPTLWADGAGYSIDYSIHMEGDKTEIGMWNGSLYSTLPVSFAGTNWHHLVTIFDGGQFFIYWDGKFSGSYFKVLGANPSNFQIGSSAASGGEGWIGMIDEVAVYSSALDSNTIAAHYQAFFEHTPPVIGTQPVGGTFLPGAALELSVVATGPNLSYQWFNGSNSMLGQTNPVLSFGPLAGNQVGTYHVVVSNSSGQVPSDNVTVAIGTLPSQLVHYQTAVSNEPSLTAYYTFDGLTANDAFGTNTGTLEGTAIYASGVAGGAGQGVSFDGGARVNLGPNPSFAMTSGTGSVEAWVRADWAGVFPAYNPTLFANEDFNNSQTQWSVHMTGDKLYVYVYNGSANAVFAVPNGGAGTNWHHLAVVFEGGTNQTMYWDGASIGSINQALGGTITQTQLGSSSPESTTEGWMGMLDEVAFYTNALSAADVQAHYQAFYQGVTPVISVQPPSGNFLVGSYFAMSAQAQGAPLSYQWYKNNAPLSGQTNLTVYFNSLGLGDSGTYYVVASNAFGLAQSLNAILSVGNNIARYQSTVRNESSLISYYTFDTGTGADSAGTNQGSLQGTVSFGAGPGGVTNEALVLAGAGRVDLGQVSAFDFVDGGTAEAWIRADWSLSAQPSYAPCIFADRHDATGGSVWSVHMVQAQNAIGNWNNDRFITLPVNDPGGWHHFAITFGDGLVSMYWDGQSVGIFNQAINFFSGQTTQIGGSQPDTTQEAWIGALDEVAFYGSVLSPEAISNHYLAMVGPATAPLLALSVSVGSITLSWPAGVSGFALESTASLTTPSWASVGGVVSNSVTVPISTGNQFFRLRN